MPIFSNTPSTRTSPIPNTSSVPIIFTSSSPNSSAKSQKVRRPPPAFKLVLLGFTIGSICWHLESPSISNKLGLPQPPLEQHPFMFILLLWVGTNEFDGDGLFSFDDLDGHEKDSRYGRLWHRGCERLYGPSEDRRITIHWMPHLTKSMPILESDDQTTQTIRKLAIHFKREEDEGRKRQWKEQRAILLLTFTF